MTYLPGIDTSTTATKALVIDETGPRLYLALAPDCCEVGHVM